MEYLDVYDENGKATSKIVKRGSPDSAFEKGEHIAVAIIFIENSKGEFLIQKTSKKKGGLYSSTGGHVDHGETPDQAIIREVKEEIGIDISKDKIESLGYRLVDFPVRFLYYLNKDIRLEDLVVDPSEVERVSYMSPSFIEALIDKGLMNKGHALMYKEIIKYLGGKNGKEKN
jgi:mutator protein MutT